MGKSYDNGHSPSGRIRNRPTMFMAEMPDGREGIILQYGTLDRTDGRFYPSGDPRVGNICQLLVGKNIVYCSENKLHHTVMLQWA